MGLFPVQQQELFRWLLLLSENNPLRFSYHGQKGVALSILQKCAPQTSLTERITHVAGAHWPLNEGCALPIGPEGLSRGGERRTLLHEMAKSNLCGGLTAAKESKAFGKR